MPPEGGGGGGGGVRQGGIDLLLLYRVVPGRYLDFGIDSIPSTIPKSIDSIPSTRRTALIVLYAHMF